MSRRMMLAQAIGAAGALLPRAISAQLKTSILVFKDPSCGCCHKWVDHMEGNGFKASVTDGPMGPVHARYKVPERLQSCHTASVGGYVIEGHVPASDVKALLAKKPKGILGLTIPGMPQSAPGMDVMPFQPYTVLTFDEKGATTVFAKHDRP
jgi:hypothetical protein